MTEKHTRRVQAATTQKCEERSERWDLDGSPACDQLSVINNLLSCDKDEFRPPDVITRSIKLFSNSFQISPSILVTTPPFVLSSVYSDLCYIDLLLMILVIFITDQLASYVC